jgi:hypothetical protein
MPIRILILSAFVCAGIASAQTAGVSLHAQSLTDAAAAEVYR